MKQKLLSTRNVVLALLSVLLALCLAFGIFAFMPGQAHADEGQGETVTAFHDSADCDSTATHVAKIGDVEYDTLANAIAAAQDGETITLLKCVEESSTLAITIPNAVNNITIDFDGHTLNSSRSGDSNYGVTLDCDSTTICNLENGSIVAQTSRGLGVNNNIIAYLKNMTIMSKSYCVVRSGANSGVYFISGNYINGRTIAMTGISNRIGNSWSYDSFKFADQDDKPLKFRYQNIELGNNKYKLGDFSKQLDNLPKGYMLDIDADGLGYEIKKDDYKYFVGTRTNDKYTNFIDAINDGNTEVKLNRNVPATVEDADGKTITHTYEVPQGANLTLDLNEQTFSATIKNSGNLTLTGPNQRDNEGVFDGTIAENNGTITATYLFEIRGNAKEYINNNTINVANGSYIKVTPVWIYDEDDWSAPPVIDYSNCYYTVYRAEIEIGEKTYGTYNAAIKDGVRNISIDGTWVGNDRWIEDIIVDIGNSELTIDLCGNTLMGMGTAEGANMALNIISGNVTVKNGAIRAAINNASYDPTLKARSYAIKNAGTLTLENVDVGGCVYGNALPVTQGAVIRNTGTLVMNGGAIRNALTNTDENNDVIEGVEVGSGIYNESGSLELNGVELVVSLGYGVYACEGSSVNIKRGTSTRVQPTMGAIIVEEGANIVLGKSTLYSTIDLTPYVDTNLCVKKTVGTYGTTYNIDEHSYAAPVWNWADNNLSCTATFSCTYGGEPDLIVPATVTYPTVNNPCNAGTTINYTATVQFNGTIYTGEKSVTNEGGAHTYAIRTTQGGDKTTYTAFEKFVTEGIFVERYCALCGTSEGYIQVKSEVNPTGYVVIYENDSDCFHYGHNKVKISHTYEGKTYTCDVLVTVNKFESQIKWQYNRDENGADDTWTDIDENTVLSYDGNEWYIRAAYEKYSTDEKQYGYITVDSVLNANTYVRTVNVADYPDYGFVGGTEITLTVEPQKVNLSDRNTFSFVLASHENAPLMSNTVTPIYIYTTAGGSEYPSYSLLDLNDSTYADWKFKETVSVVYSVVRYRGDKVPLTIGVGDYDTEKFSCELDGTSNPTVSAVGVYTIKVNLTATNNYAFESSFASSIYNRGLTFDISTDNKTAVVTKVWYVVQMDNYLVQASDSTKDYEIKGWTYGEDVTVPAPALFVGTDYSNVTYTLSGVEKPFGHDDFAKYLNGNTPAGKYTLEIRIPALPVEGILYKGATFTYEFEVKAATIGLDITPDEKTGYGDFTWKLTSTNRSAFFTEFVDLVKDNVEFKNNANNTVSYEMRFNFSRMNNNVYYNASRTELTDLIEGGRQGTYTVYFSIKADNHVTLGGEEDANRNKYFFTVTVYEEINPDSIKVSNVAYTGGKVVPDITSVDVNSDVYEVIWAANDSYINGGSHSVSLKLYDTDHYVWKDKNSDTVTKTFQITPANNDKWAQAPGVIGWEHGYFDKDKNLFTAVPKFLDDGEAVHFAIKDSKGETVQGLGDMTAVNGVIAEEFRTKLNQLPAGSYTLAVTVKATANYSGNSATVTFAVSKSTNTWAITPNVMQWRYNSYNKAINLILGEAKIQDESNPVVFKVTSDAEGETVLIDSFSLEAGVVPAAAATKLGELTVGTYYLWSYVKGTDSYSELQPDEPFEFAISAAINDWTTAPNVIGWSYGDYNKSTNLILGSAINGTVTFSVAASNGSTVKGLESFTSVNDTIAGILAGLAAGEYTVTATVEADSNYQSVNAGTATLTVAKAVNAWVETPSIITWVKGQYNAEENVITVSDSFNSVIDIVIYQADDDENIIYQVDGGEVVIDNLAIAEIGHYILKAIVNDTANYGGLEKTFSFQIFAPEGLAWWAWLLIIVGILGVIALVFWILHEKGILQMLTGKFVIAMRTKMTVDATIAAVRANMVAQNSKKTKAAAERKDRLEALRKAREEGDTRSAEEQAAALEEKARVAAEKAEKMQKRANRMQKRAEKARDKVESTAQAEATAEDVTPETTDEGETPDEN